MAIATGIANSSENAKTGRMVQTWIMRSDVHPFAAIHDGDDESVCGDCPLRGRLEEGPLKLVNRGRSCYVNVAWAPSQVWSTWRDGRYHQLSSRRLKLIAGLPVRLGSYGDPVAVPVHLWEQLVSSATGHTGYTHQWRKRRHRSYRHLLMASVESQRDADLARSRGWRTFRIRQPGEPLLSREFACPASNEQGNRLTCAECLACDGAGANHQRASVAIVIHGSPSILGSYNHLRIQQ